MLVKFVPSYKDIKNSKINEFTGQDYFKYPPKVSAVKINGQRAYKLVEIIYKFEILSKKCICKKFNFKHKKKEQHLKLNVVKVFILEVLQEIYHIKLKHMVIFQFRKIKSRKIYKITSILLDDLMKIGQRQ